MRQVYVVTDTFSTWVWLSGILAQWHCVTKASFGNPSGKSISGVAGADKSCYISANLTQTESPNFLSNLREMHKTAETPEGPSTDRVDSEGDNHDCKPLDGVATTVGAFSTWIKQKKKEKEAALSEAERLKRIRHDTILRVMLDIRRALVEVSQLELSERFAFRLTSDDWHGWPRLTLRLSDTALESADYPYFQVIAHDRQGRGSVEIIYGNPLQPEKISLAQEAEIRRLPNTLKRCVRFYLDLIGQIVLEAETGSSEEVAESLISTATHTALEDSLTGDLYEDYEVTADYLERLPDLNDISELPGFEKDKSRS